MNYDFSYLDIVTQCNSMVYLNLASFALLSGSGNMEKPREGEMVRINDLLKDIHEEKKPRNIMFMTSLYQKSLPEYAAAPQSPYDFTGFQWSEKKLKREIHPDTLSHSVFCMSTLISKILSLDIRVENKEFIAYCLALSAAKQAHFLIEFLKDGDFYYPGRDIGNGTYGEYCIEMLPENPELKTQFFVMEAFSSLLQAISSYPEYRTEISGLLEKELAMLPVLCDNLIENVTDISSRDLAVIGLSLHQIYQSTEAGRHALYAALNTLGCELHERLFPWGDIRRSMLDHEISSFSTLCNCLNLFVRLHELTGMDEYKKAYFAVYDRIDSFWNPMIALFITSGRNKQKYTIKDIGFTISALKTLRNGLTDPDLFAYVEDQFIGFYESAFISSKIFNSQLYPILQSDKLELQPLGSIDKNCAPVFSKSFEVKISKNKYYCEPDIFQAEYVLLGCKYLLY